MNTKTKQWTAAGRKTAPCTECGLPMGLNNWKRHFKAAHRGKPIPPFPKSADDKSPLELVKHDLKRNGDKLKRKYAKRLVLPEPTVTDDPLAAYNLAVKHAMAARNALETERGRLMERVNIIDELIGKRHEGASREELLGLSEAKTV